MFTKQSLPKPLSDSHQDRRAGGCRWGQSHNDLPLCCAGAFDSFLNIQITLVLLAQLTICLAFAVGSYAWRQTKGYDHYYLGMDHYSNGNYQNGFVYVIILFITFWILFSYLVPISLFVTIEIIKFVLVSINSGLCWFSLSDHRAFHRFSALIL